MLGNKDMPESLAEFQKMKYNDIDKFELLTDYKNSVEKGSVSPLIGFNKYSQIKKEIEEKIVGLTTKNGIKITGQRKHFIDRVIGSVEQRRNGVEIEDIIECVTKGAVSEVIKINKFGNRSIKLIIPNKIVVSVNIDTGKLIQTNPLNRRKNV